MQGSLFDREIASGAILSDCGVYRYSLWRYWEPDAPKCNFLMLNPSTADHRVDDPTIKRCIGFARSWDYGGIIVSNLFALRSTDPAGLVRVADPVGPYNDLHIMAAASGSAIVVAAWGAHPGIASRVRDVRRLLAAAEVSLHCLSLTKGGHPGHPLFLKGELRPVLMEV